MTVDNGVTEIFTSEDVAQAFYDYLDKRIGWAEFRRVHSVWFEGATPA